MKVGDSLKITTELDGKVRYYRGKINCMNYSFFCILPIEWLRNHGIGKGDSVYMTILEDGSLILKPKRKGEQ